MSSASNSRTQQPESGKWKDRLNLCGVLAVPFVVLAATIWFTLWQNNLSNLQHQYDIVDTYISDMKDLVNQGPGAAAGSQTAEEETITTLQRLNAENNRTVLQFLQEARLIGGPHPVIDLSNADLSNDALSDAPLNGIDLKNANLSHADLSGADLGGATMYGANLTGADLSGATLAGASLSDANVTGANLSGADLSSSDLPGANITQSQLDVVRSCTRASLPNGVTCQPQQSPPIQLTYWYTESGAEATEILKLVKKFNQEHSDIQVNAMYENFFQARTAFTTAIQQGKAPDVLRSDVGWTPLFASKGYLLNLGPYVSQSDLSDYLNAPLSTTNGIPPSTTRGIGPALSAPLVYDEYKGGLYGLPEVTDFPALLYNWNELNEAGITSPPVTMDDFEKDAVEIAQKGAAKYGFEFDGSSYGALPFLYACGGGMFDQYDNILVNNSGSVAGLNFLVELQKVGNVQVMPPTPSFSAPPGTMVKDFMNGRTAMIFDGPSDLNGILTSSGSVFKKHPGYLGIAPIPTGPGRQTRAPLGGQSYVISAGTAHPVEAYKFIQFMNSTSSQAAIAEANHTLPTRLSAYQDSGVSSDQFISAFLSFRDTVVARPAGPRTAYLFDTADPDVWAALYGDQSPDEALNAIAYSWKQLGAGTFTPSPGTSPEAC